MSKTLVQIGRTTYEVDSVRATTSQHGDNFMQSVEIVDDHHTFRLATPWAENATAPDDFAVIQVVARGARPRWVVTQNAWPAGFELHGEPDIVAGSMLVCQMRRVMAEQAPILDSWGHSD